MQTCWILVCYGSLKSPESQTSLSIAKEKSNNSTNVHSYCVILHEAFHIIASPNERVSVILNKANKTKFIKKKKLNYFKIWSKMYHCEWMSNILHTKSMFAL